MNIEKDLLKRLTLLYVEDDDVIRNELYQLLSKFFKKVHIACDGKEGLLEYGKNKSDIDIILTDINMPALNGIDMITAIRQENKTIPVFFCTAYSDNEFLAQAIKLKVHEYVVKPIDIRNLLNDLSSLASSLYQDFLIKQKSKELGRYKEITDSNNIVIETDIHMNITNVNELFCTSTGFSKEELIGEEFLRLRHPDSSKDVYTDIFSKVLNNKSWHGILKNITKDHGFINVDTFADSIINDSGELIGTIFIQKDITHELSKKREVQLALMKDKSDIFIRGKEGSAEQTIIINGLKFELSSMEKKFDEAKAEKNKYIYTIEKYTVENRRLKSELATYKKNADLVDDKNHNSFKLNKENSDLRMEIKRLHSLIEEIHKENEKDTKQLKVNYEVEIDELQEQISQFSDKLSNMDTNEVLEQKLIYWKEKAKNESLRVEDLEKQIIAHGDKSFMSKIFG